MIANKNDFNKWLEIKVIVTNDYKKKVIVTKDCKFSSNLNEVIRSILNSFFLQKGVTHTKSTKPLTVNINKKNAFKNI